MPNQDDFSRRNFMQLLGIGGLGLAVGSSTIAQAAERLPLFGSADTPQLIVPDNKLIGRHHIVQKKGLTEKVPVADRNKTSVPGAVVIARMTRQKKPGNALVNWNTYRLERKPPVIDGEDPNAVYYKACHGLRKEFADISRQTLLSIEPHLRPMATLLTIVEVPLHARARGWDWTAKDDYENGGRDQDRGFDIVGIFQQGYALGPVNVETFNTYSEQGEYPMEIPRNIDMSMLMKLDKQILATPDMLRAPTRAWRVST